MGFQHNCDPRDFRELCVTITVWGPVVLLGLVGRPIPDMLLVFYLLESREPLLDVV
jgi:hypothetical protein